MNKKKTVCIIEDNPLLLKNICEMLEIQYTVISASNGFDGYQVIKQTLPDIIVTDIMMPELDGMELIKFLKTNNELEKIPVIILSALNEEESILKGYEKGAIDYVVKPFSMKILLAKIESMLKIAPKGKIGTLEVSDAFLQKIHHYINDNITNPDIYIHELSDRLNISSQQLRRRLLRVTGKNFSNYLIDFRLEKANKLVLMSTLSINEIAHQSGFKSASYFIKVYKRKFNKTPLEMRGQLRTKI